MMMRAVAKSVGLLLGLFLLVPGASAQGVTDRFDCRLMRGLQCSAESRAELLALYGLPSAESRLAAGIEMYRVFVFDAWMRHYVAITVERGPGAGPTLTLQAPPRPGSDAVPPLSVPISLGHWYRVRRAAANFDRVMVPEPEDPNVIRICTGHGPLQFVESVEGDETEATEQRRLRRSGLGQCSEGLAHRFGVEIEIIVTEVLPACAALEEGAFYFIAERLRACAILSGDRLAAAEVYNAMRPLLADERPSADQLYRLFRDAGSLETGPGAGVSPEQAWLQALGGEDGPRFVVERVHADNASHVVVDGLFRRRELVEDGSGARRVEEAPVQMVWRRSRSYAPIEIDQLVIGAFEAVLDRCNSSDRSRRAADC